MSYNKNYSRREMVIDRLLHRPEGATLKEMMAECNKELERDGFPLVNSLNTIFSDIENLCNRYGQQYETFKEEYDRRIVRYRYVNRDFSVYRIGLSPEDSTLLSNALSMLSQFQGLPVAQWLAETDLRIRSSVMSDGHSAVVGFDTSPEYAGNKNLLPLYEAITKRQTLEVVYWDWAKGKQALTIWPYYLKQAGHLWYLLAGNVRNDKLLSLGIDRIESITTIDRKYHDCKVNLQQYFDDRIGATASDLHKKKQTIRFWASLQAWPYLVQSPIHKSQKLIDQSLENGAIFQIEVCYTRELIQELQRYGSDIMVLEPDDLRCSLAHDAALLLQRYGYTGIDPDKVTEVVPEPEDSLSFKNPTEEIINPKNNKKMKVLNLIIKQVYFDQILSGEKTQEFREVKPTTVKKYVELDEDGFEKEDENCNAIPIKYDAIRFFVGYNPDRDSALVEVKDAYCEMFVDENGELITYEHNGQEWIAEQVVYNLGKVLEKDIHPKK